MNRNITLLLVIILIVLIIMIVKKSLEKFCIDESQSLEYESYVNSGLPLNSVYKDSMKQFLDKVEKDKIENHSVLGSVQNPMSDRNHNTRILYQPPQDVYKF